MTQVVPCSTPPGGTITCDDNQLAVCGTFDGRLVVGCFDMPRPPAGFIGSKKSAFLRRWAIEKITGGMPLSPVQQRQVLARGHLRTGDGKTDIRFRLPAEMRGHKPSKNVNKYRRFRGAE